MSQFIGNTGNNAVLSSNNIRLYPLKGLGAPMLGAGVSPGIGPKKARSYHSPWWPRSAFMGDMAVDIGPNKVKGWLILQSTKGMNSRLGYMGVTRDVNNSPLLSATVKLFRTSTDEKVSTDIVSDALSGEYVISTPYYEAHWLKVEKNGSPNVQGVSVNNIFPNV